MWSDWLVFCDCGFNLSALWYPLSAPTVLLGFLLSWMWGILHSCSSKVQPLVLTLEVGYFHTAAACDLGCGVSPLCRSSTTQPLGYIKIMLPSCNLGDLFKPEWLHCGYPWGFCSVVISLVHHQNLLWNAYFLTWFQAQCSSFCPKGVLLDIFLYWSKNVASYP